MEPRIGKWIAAVGVALAFAATAVDAHSRMYVLGISEASGSSFSGVHQVSTNSEANIGIGVTSLVCVSPTLVGIGGTCFEAGHVPGFGAPGERAAILSLDEHFKDLVIPMIGGIYCQDVDFDDFCGENGEPSEAFCQVVTIVESQSASLSGADWDMGLPIVILVDGAVHGFVGGGCGFLGLSTGLSGSVSHSG